MSPVPLLLSVLWAAEPQTPESSVPEPVEVAEEPEGGAGVSPVELIPRVEVRHSFVRLPNGMPVNSTTFEADLQFFSRMLLRYELVSQNLRTPDGGEVSGPGDTKLTGLLVITSTKTRLAAAIAGAVLDTASQPQLGAGKQQIFFGGGAAIKPYPFWLIYGVLQQQLSLGGDKMRPDVNQLAVDAGSILFGPHYRWIKIDVNPTVDFVPNVQSRLFGVLELGSLLIGRVGLFVRTSTQLVGQRELEYSLAGGIRYLFRLDISKPPGG